MINTIENLGGITDLAVGRSNSLGGPDRAAQISGADSVSSADFTSALADAAKGLADNIREGEATAIAAMKGEVSIQEAVETVLRAEQTLQSAVAVRDRVIAAYQEISRMQI